MSVYRLNAMYLVIFFAYLITVVYCATGESSGSNYIQQFTGIGLPSYDKMIEEMGTFMSFNVERVTIDQSNEYGGEIKIYQERHPIDVVAYSFVHSVPSTASGSAPDQMESDDVTHNRIFRFYTPQLLSGKYDSYANTIELQLTNDINCEIKFEKFEDAKYFSSYFRPVDVEIETNYSSSKKELIPNIPIGMKVSKASIMKYGQQGADPLAGRTYQGILLLMNKNSANEIACSIELGNVPISTTVQRMTPLDIESVELLGAIGKPYELKFIYKSNADNISHIMLEFIFLSDYVLAASSLTDNWHY